VVRLTGEAYFWSMVDKRGPEDCWEWQGFRNPKGYGRVKMNCRSVMAHRVAYELEVGRIPEGLDVCHHCDNRACCNPSHLFTGTHTDNNRDRHLKGRSAGPKGERHGRNKLTDDLVMEIRRRHLAGGVTFNELGRQYGVTGVMVRFIVTGKNWNHLPVTGIALEPQEGALSY
jgi:hypothetical protein